MIRLLSCIIIVAGCQGMGLYYSHLSRRRIMFLKEVRTTYKLILKYIENGQKTLPEAFITISKKVGFSSISEFYQTLYEALRERKYRDFSECFTVSVDNNLKEVSLKKEDFEAIKMMANIPTHLGIRDQSVIILEAINSLDNLIYQLEKSLGGMCKIFNCLGFAIGSVIVLILI